MSYRPASIARSSSPGSHPPWADPGSDESGGCKKSAAAGALGLAVAIALSTLYCVVFLVRLPPSWPAPLRHALKLPPRWIHRLTDAAFQLVAVEPHHAEFLSAVCLLLTAGVMPWLMLALLGRGRPYDLGFRRPNRFAWRVTLVGYLVALPFIVWMVGGVGFAGPYLGRLQRAGGLVFILYYFVNMLAEHFFFHGALLAVCRPGRRWPPPAPVASSSRVRPGRTLQWLGLAQPTEGAAGARRLTRWIGLAVGCVPAIVTSAMLFGLVHIGKDPRELLLSVPGGIALAYLAYRTNTWLTPFVLHLATAGTAFAMMLAMN